jgi:sugar diacid utilization regulator
MEISFKELGEKLSAFNPETQICCENARIKTAKLLNREETFFEPDIIYIGYASNLPDDMSTVHNANFLCLIDKNLPQRNKKSIGSNLITVDCKVDLALIFNTVQDILAERRNLVYGYEKLLRSLIRAKGIQEIIDTAFELIGNPIIVLSNNYEILAYTRNVEINDPVWNHTVTVGKTPESFIDSIKTGRIIEKVYKSKSAVLVQSSSSRCRDIMGKVEIDGKIVAHIGIGEYLAPFKENDLELATLLCSVLSAEMQKNKLFRNTKRIMFEHFITDLLDGKVMKNEIMSERMQHIDLDLKGCLYVITVNIEDYEILNTTISYARDQLENLVFGSKSLIYNNQIVLIISTQSDRPFFDTDLQSLENYLKGNKMYAGISRRFTDIAMLRKHYMQSLRSIKLGIIMHKHKVLFSFEDYAPYQLMDLRSKEEDIKDFCHPGITALMDYDLLNGTCFTKSLLVYIENGMNVVESARILHIHRNTMTYRIEKIQKITGIDLAGKNMLFHIHLSLKVLEFTGEIK